MKYSVHENVPRCLTGWRDDTLGYDYDGGSVNVEFKRGCFVPKCLLDMDVTVAEEVTNLEKSSEMLDSRNTTPPTHSDKWCLA